MKKQYWPWKILVQKLKGLEPGPEPTPPESDEKQTEGKFRFFGSKLVSIKILQWNLILKYFFNPIFLRSEQNEAEKEESDVQVQQPDSDLWAGGRQMLRQYLQEVGFTDTILDARSARLRALLGGAGGDNEGLSLKLDIFRNDYKRQICRGDSALQLWSISCVKILSN